MSSRRNQRGFSLLEVLVALAVVSVALAGAIHTVIHAATTTDHLDRRTLAHWVAQNRLVLARAGELDTEAEVETGTRTSSMGGRRWPWRLQRQVFEDIGLEQLTVEVYETVNAPALVRLVGYRELPLLDRPQ